MCQVERGARHFCQCENERICQRETSLMVDSLGATAGGEFIECNSAQEEQGDKREHTDFD